MSNFNHNSGYGADNNESKGFELTSHVYPENCSKSEARFVIIISSDSDNITGILASRGEMQVEYIDIIGCQSLTYFYASWQIDHFDFRRNPGIERVDLQGNVCVIADVTIICHA